MLSFFGEVLRSYRTTGAVAPSSRILARKMTQALREQTGAKRVLEVGPGTGVFTKQVLESLKPGDAYDIVEINSTFTAQLQEKLIDPFLKSNPDISIEMHNTAIEDAELSGDYDYIVCGLPFNCFPLHVVSQIFRKMMSLLREGGGLTYFEYLGMKAVKMPWVGRQGRKQLRRRIAMCKLLDRRWSGRRDLVVGNLPPAHAIHLTA